MKIKVADLYDLSLGLNDLSDKDLAISTSLNVEKNHRNVSEELVSTDKIRQKIIEKYKYKNLSDGAVQIRRDKIEIYNKEINELMQQDVDISLQEIKLKELEGITIKPRSISHLNKVLKMDDAE